MTDDPTSTADPADPMDSGDFLDGPYGDMTEVGNLSGEQMQDGIQETVDISQMDRKKLDPSTLLLIPEPEAMYSYANVCLITEEIPLQLLYSAYMQGAFPWFSEDEGEPVVWYSPNPRFCLRMENLDVPKSVDKFLRHCPYTFSMDRAFDQVIENCRSMDRPGQDGTWIGRKMIEAYSDFHKAGFAHSVEVWHEGKLCGGLYGVLIGSVFCGESMFTLESNSAKCAFVLFARAFGSCGGKLIDSQVYTDNIARYGASNISRDAFLRLEGQWLCQPLESEIQEAFRDELERCGLEWEEA